MFAKFEIQTKFAFHLVKVELSFDKIELVHIIKSVLVKQFVFFIEKILDNLCTNNKIKLMPSNAFKFNQNLLCEWNR